MVSRVEEYEREILRGLSNETQRLDRAKLNIEIYHGNHVDPEANFYDKDGRAKRDLPLMSKVVDQLTAYPYQEAPSRILPGHEQATQFLDRVYDQNRVNTMLQASDRYRHAANIFALQVHATGNPEKPIKIYAWTADSLVIWTDPDDQTEPKCVCTIDRYDNQTRYRLWTDEECRTYVTRKWNGETAGGRMPTLQSAIPNPYGIIPFAFFHLLPPITQFDEGGIGDTLAQMEQHINFRLMENADHLRYSKPRGFLMGVPAAKDLIRRPRAGEWDRFPVNPPSDARESAGTNPDVKWIAPPFDWLEAEWDDLRYFWNWTLESVGVPAASIPLDKAIIATVSGAALIARNIPLFLYARKTQNQYKHYEQELARVVLRVADAVYGIGDKSAIDEPLTVNFGEVVPDMPPDSPDDYLDNLKLKGELSEIQVTMKRFGFTREQAIEHIEQIYKDESLVAELKKKYAPAPAVMPTQPPDVVTEDNPAVQDQPPEPKPQAKVPAEQA